MRKILFITLLFSMQAVALNQTMLNMPANNSYMKFAMTKYLSWHRKQFNFPEDSELISSLIQKLDNWMVPGTPYYQTTITHGVDDSRKYFMKLRLFVVPELRTRKEFTGAGVPAGKELMFYEKDDSGKVCLIFRESVASFSAWCRKKSGEKFSPEWTEHISETSSSPEDWPFPFPYMSSKVIMKKVANEVTEVSFFQVGAHPSRMPEALYAPVYYNTKEPLFPLDRVTTSRHGGMSVHYP